MILRSYFHFFFFLYFDMLFFFSFGLLRLEIDICADEDIDAFLSASNLSS